MSHRILLATLSLLLAASLFGQQDQGFLTGTVRDGTGAVIPGAQVVAREVSTNINTSAFANERGTYVLGPVKIGVYEVSVELQGFKKSVRSDVEVHPNDRIGLDFTLEIGAISDIVTVTGQTPMLKTETSSLEHVVDRKAMEQLPLLDRNYQVLAKLSAGVLPEIGGRDRGPLQRGGTLASGFTSHGQPSLQNNYLIDGVDNNSTVMGMQDRKAQAVIPSLDAVQEFKVQTSNYSAEFGRNAGAVINVTIKGGTNQFHGSVYDYLRNDAFDARPTFSYADLDGDGKADAEVLRQNMYGGTFGGPIVHDKAFFFASYEGWKIRNQQSDRSTVPTALERQGDFSQTAGLSALKDPQGGTFPGMKIPASRMDPVTLKLMELFPEPNYSDITRTNYLSSPPWTTDRDQLDTRVDYRLTDKDSIFGRFSWYKFKALRSPPLPGLAQGAAGNDRSLDDNRGRHLAISYTRIVNNALVNEFRFGYKVLNVRKQNELEIPIAEANGTYGIKGINPPAKGEIYGLTRFTLSGGLGFAGFGGANNQPNIKDTATYQYLDNLTWIRGNHSFKAGADIRYDSTTINGSKQARGQYNFNGRYTGISLGDMLLGWANTAQTSTLTFGEMFFRSWMFYAQDDWKITPEFTLNIGLRYELTTPWVEKSNHATAVNLVRGSADFGAIEYAGGSSYASRALIDVDKNNFAPRIGFAWRPGKKWTLRAGAGVFYGGQMSLGASARTMQNYPFESTVVQRATSKVPAMLVVNGFPANFLGDLSPVYHLNDLPANANYITWDRNLPVPQIHQWNLSVQRELRQDMVLTLAYVGSASQNLAYDYDYNAAGIGDPNTEKQRRTFPNVAALTYRGALAHSSYHGMDLSVEKRFSHGFAFGGAYTWSHNLGQMPDLFVDGDNGAPQDIHCISCEKGNSSSDVRHRFATSYVWDLPLGRNRRWLNQGGVANAILGGWQLTGFISAQTGMYFTPTLANSNQYLGTGGVGVWRPDQVGDYKVSNPGPDGWFNGAAFIRPCDANNQNCRFGSLGRNTMQEPGMFDWTAALGKTFMVAERYKLEFRAEALNLLNHPSYGTPNRSIDSLDVGVIRGTLSTERLMQFSLKFSF